LSGKPTQKTVHVGLKPPAGAETGQSGIEMEGQPTKSESPWARRSKYASRVGPLTLPARFSFAMFVDRNAWACGNLHVDGDGEEIHIRQCRVGVLEISCDPWEVDSLRFSRNIPKALV